MCDSVVQVAAIAAYPILTHGIEAYAIGAVKILHGDEDHPDECGEQVSGVSASGPMPEYV